MRKSVDKIVGKLSKVAQELRDAAEHHGVSEANQIEMMRQAQGRAETHKEERNRAQRVAENIESLLK